MGDEECDDGVNNGDGTSTCTSGCTLDVCGDAYLVTASDEECDDGASNGNGTSTCTLGCTLDTCGDGYLVTGSDEECDDGSSNGDGTSTCTSTCTENVCGDGYEAGDEECDDGANNGNGTSACTSGCTVNVCGDGYLAGTEECETDSVLTNATCDSACQVVCDFGFGDCGGSLLSCETPLNTNANCGGCGDACTTLGGGTGSTVACNAQTLLCEATVVYTATADATVVDGGTTPLGLTATLLTDAGGGSQDYQLSLLRVVGLTTNIPTTSTITGVTVSVRVRTDSAGNPATMNEVTSSWAEDTVTGTTFDYTTSVVTTSNLEGTTPTPVAGSYAVYSGTALTSLVQAWVSGTKSNFGVALVPTGTAETSWHSRQATIGNRPFFTITLTYDAGDL